jgi:hypothetical protein
LSSSECYEYSNKVIKTGLRIFLNNLITNFIMIVLVTTEVYFVCKAASRVTKTRRTTWRSGAAEDRRMLNETKTAVAIGRGHRWCLWNRNEKTPHRPRSDAPETGKTMLNTHRRGGQRTGSSPQSTQSSNGCFLAYIPS